MEKGFGWCVSALCVRVGVSLLAGLAQTRGAHGRGRGWRVGETDDERGMSVEGRETRREVRQNSSENEKSKDEETSDQMETEKLGWCEGEEEKHLDSLSERWLYVRRRLNQASVANRPT